VQGDDFGMCHAVNEGVALAFREGVVTQASAMAACPWFDEAARLALDLAMPVGLHQTLTCEWDYLRWGPLTRNDALADPDGTFPRSVAGAQRGLDHHDVQVREAQLRRAADGRGSLSRPNSGLPEFGTLSGPKSDKSDFGWERDGVRGFGLSMVGMAKATIDSARRLRRDQTHAERVMWFRLRDRRLAGWKFRRQVPIDRFVVDFFCVERKLIVEIDGGQHDHGRQRDADRTRNLEAMGYLVLRFWNHEVLQNIDGVLESLQGKGFFVAEKRQVYSKAERLRRLRQALDTFVHEAVFLDFTPDEIREAVDDKLSDLDLQPKSAGEKA